MTGPSRRVVSALVGLALAHASQLSQAIPPRTCPGPTVAQTIDAALRQAGLSRSRAGSWQRRLRWSFLLPRIGARFGRSSATSDYLDYDPTTAGDLDRRRYNGIRWQVHATWDLSSLVFDSTELRVVDAAGELQRRRRELVRRVVTLYFRRCGLLDMAMAGPRTGPRRRTQQLKLLRTNALLDALTGGLFTSMAHRR